MNRKELVKKAIHMDNPDHAPLFLYNKDQKDSDIVVIEVVKHWMGKNKDKSEWGFIWEKHDDTMGQPKESCIKTWDDFNTLKIPNPYREDRFKGIDDTMKQYGDKYYLASLALSGFTVMTFLRGFTETLEDLYFERENIAKLADVVFGFEDKIIEQLKCNGFDGVAFFDDWGTQTNLIISPKLWREFFKPIYKRQFEIAHKHGLDVYFHCCGYIYDIIPDLIEIGVDMLNLSQPNIFDLEKLGKEFEGKVCFVCPISYQTTSLLGSKEDIYTEAKKLIDNLGSGNGGFIGYVEEYHSIGLSDENYQNCINAFRELGKYKAKETEDKIMEIVVEGDLLGHLIGTVSMNEGQTACAGVGINVRGLTRLGLWEDTAKTDENGVFMVDLPVSIRECLEITAKKDKLTAKLIVDVCDIASFLTPRSSKDLMKSIHLEGEWDFMVDPPKNITTEMDTAGWNKISVPSHWEMEGFVSETGRAAYRKIVFIPNEWKNKRIKFRYDGIYSKAEVWLNDLRVGSHIGGATPFELDLTENIKLGQDNVILIIVSDESDAINLDSMSYYAHFNLGGIWRPLEIFCIEAAHISKIAIKTEFDEGYKDAQLSIDLDILNEHGNEIKDTKINFHLYDPQEKEVEIKGLIEKVTLLPWALKHLCLEIKVMEPEQWNAEDPRLYKLVVELDIGKNVNERIEQTIGFRDVKIKNKVFLINGHPVKLFGACHHDSHPLSGRAVGKEIIKQDIELMKAANMNALRTSHYPPYPALLDYTDSMGMYVEVDAPFCFVDSSIASDLRLAPLGLRLTMETIERDRNHPSVVIWSQCNESAFGEVLNLALKYAKVSDKSRPFSTGASSDIGLAEYLDEKVRDKYNEWCTEKDVIATYHYIGNAEHIKSLSNFNVPVFHDEALAMFIGSRTQAMALELDPGLRDYWITGYFDLYKALNNDDQQMGALIWGWSDDNFLVPGKGILYGMTIFPKVYYVDRIYKMPGRGIVGNFPWGLVDGWRRARPEWWTTKKLFSPIFIEENPLELPSLGRPIMITIQNRNVFINLNRYTLQWKTGCEKGICTLDILPQSTETVSIMPKQEISANSILELAFFNREGVLVDGYRLTFNSRKIEPLPNSGNCASIIEEKPSLNFGSIVCMVGKNTELAFDRTSGLLIRGMAGKEQAVLSGPYLHIMEDNAPMEAYAKDWKFLCEEHHLDVNNAVLDWKGRYDKDITGTYRIQMDDEGNISVEYSFDYTGSGIIAREIGLRFKIPLYCDRFEWDRKAEWSYYPEDHIGRPRGKASAHSEVPQTVPPGNRPFSLDDHMWGCNDFRSTKRNIYWAEFTDPEGNGIKIISDGTQHVRANLDFDSISINVLDYYGGNSIGSWEWAGDYEIGRTIHKGDNINGTISFRILNK